MRILYIEDNDELRASIASLMENEHRTIFACASAEEAWLLEKSQKFDMVMADISLPGISGVDFVKKLLEEDSQRNIILCSGYDLGHYPKQWGPNVYTLLKPFEIEELDEVLEKIEAGILKQDAV
ncbi:MAG: response regulator [Comamonas sp.]|jgi:two-component system cell cycle response regulator CpdR|nr:response regulator [Comamonas sp.]